MRIKNLKKSEICGLVLSLKILHSKVKQAREKMNERKIRKGNRNVLDDVNVVVGNIINFGSRKCYKLDGFILQHIYFQSSFTIYLKTCCYKNEM